MQRNWWKGLCNLEAEKEGEMVGGLGMGKSPWVGVGLLLRTGDLVLAVSKGQIARPETRMQGELSVLRK